MDTSACIWFCLDFEVIPLMLLILIHAFIESSVKKGICFGSLATYEIWLSRMQRYHECKLRYHILQCYESLILELITASMYKYRLYKG